MKNNNKNETKTYPLALKGLLLIVIAFTWSCYWFFKIPLNVDRCEYVEGYASYKERGMETNVIEVKVVKSGQYLYFYRIDSKDYEFKNNVVSKIWYYGKQKMPSPDNCAIIAQFEQEGVFIKKYSYWKEICSNVLWLLIPSIIVLLFSVMDVVEAYKPRKNEDKKQVTANNLEPKNKPIEWNYPEITNLEDVPDDSKIILRKEDFRVYKTISRRVLSVRFLINDIEQWKFYELPIQEFSMDYDAIADAIVKNTAT